MTKLQFASMTGFAEVTLQRSGRQSDLGQRDVRGIEPALLRSGLRVTRHPRMGAAQQPEVAARELSENKRLMEKL
jgi:hypothetical protein